MVILFSPAGSQSITSLTKGERCAESTKIGLVLLAVTLTAATAASRQQTGLTRRITFIVGAEGDPVLLDGSLVSDGTSLRVSARFLRRVVRNKPGTLAIEPALATSYKASKNGLAWTFNLRKDVKFTDGTRSTPLQCVRTSPAGVPAGAAPGDDISYYWNTVFGGYAKPAPGSNVPDKALYKGCKTAGQYRVRSC